MEVLAAIFVMGVGLLATANLFPVGALSIRQAVNEDRAGRSVQTLADAVLAYRLDHGVLPDSLPDLSAIIGHEAYSDGEDGGYIFTLSSDGATSASPAAPGKTGARQFCAPVGGPVVDCTTPAAIERAREAERRVQRNLIVLTAEHAVFLLDEDPTGQGPSLVRPYLAGRSVSEGFGLMDRNDDGQVSFGELLGADSKDPLLDSYYAEVATELELGAGGEDVDTLPGLGPASFAGDPAQVFSFETLRLLVTRYLGAAPEARALRAKLDAAEAAGKSGNSRAQDALLGAFARQVQALEHRRLSSRKAHVLVVLSSTLKTSAPGTDASPGTPGSD